MKKIYRKVLSIILMVVLFIHVLPILNTCSADGGQIKVTTLEADFADSRGYSYSDLKKMFNEYITKEKIMKAAKKGNLPGVLPTDSIVIIDYDTIIQPQYKYSYMIETYKYKVKEETIYYNSKIEMSSELAKMNSSRKYNGYDLIEKPKSGYSPGNTKHWIFVKYNRPYISLEPKSTISSLENFNAVVGNTVASKAKNLKKELYKFKCIVAVRYRKNNSNSDQTPSDNTPSPTKPQNNSDDGAKPIDNGDDKKNTETLDNGSLMQNAIKFVNQVYDINSANQNNQAVKDLVNKSKNATQIAASELTNLYINNSFEIDDYARKVYKRAYGREIKDEELKEIQDSGFSYTDLISLALSSEEFKDVCKKFDLEWGVYAAPKFNEDTTKEKATEFVKREYQAILGRAPTEEESNAIVSKLVDGKSNASIVVSAIFESSEFKNKAVDDTTFVNTLAKAVLNKDLDNKNISQYTQRLTNGETRNDLIQELLRHTAFQSTCREYSLSLGSYSPKAITTTSELAKKFTQNVSDATLGENVSTVDGVSDVLFKGDKSAGDFIRMYIEGDNFKDRVNKENVSNNEYVKILFKATLQREPSSSETSEYAQIINSQGKGTALTKLLNTKEFASICNKYYLPVKQYTDRPNEKDTKIIDDNSSGATFKKKIEMGPDGKEREVVVSVTFDLGKHIKGDVNGDGQVNASDAAVVLIYTAAMGTNFLNPTEDEIKYVDFDGNKVINAEDAAQILIMAAKIGAGQIEAPTETTNN